MNAQDFFKSDVLNLPLIRESEEKSLMDFLSITFKNYVSLLKSIDGNDIISKELLNSYDKVKKLCDSIIESLKLYYLGYPFKAYIVLKEQIEKEKTIFYNLFSTDDISRNIQFLYRIRTGDLYNYKKEDLFHIPFEKRNLVRAQRYSIPGLPCLYLGGSAFLCWEETGRPPLSNIHISRFKPTVDLVLRVLDFGNKSIYISNFAIPTPLTTYTKSLNKIDSLVIAHGIFWPLIAACSIKSSDKKDFFKSEYIIPQLLLQWILDQTDCDGIRYFSTNIGYTSISPMPVSNFVFPCRTVRDNGFCLKLIEKFELSDPLCWGIAKYTPLTPASVPNYSFSIEVVNGGYVAYSSTEFHNMETMVCGLKTSKISV
jgi:hypothetical protein